MKKILKKILVPISALFILSACALPGLGSDLTGEGEGISITGGASTEMSIMGYVVEGMVEHYIDVDANVITNLFSTMNHQATMTGAANVSAIRYTGTSLTGELGQEAVTDPKLAKEKVVEGFEREFNLKWFPSYGFANTYAFLVQEETANEYDLEKVSDLKEYQSEFDVGVDTNWINRDGDGYEDFQRLYGFEFDNLLPMSLGLMYTAFSNDEIDVALGYSTDGGIVSENLVVLEDDLNLFPPYDASPVADFEVLESYPNLELIFEKLEGKIDETIMQELNYTSDNYLIEPKVVASDWLEEMNYFEDSEPYIEPIESGEIAND
ncbi:MAG: osmoprotectant ABC transporter substrate-binding protein [Atopostipes suicloacalis]|nr:osmoprotectant ABC transporter substrate-binding protein [Atopostipes suicloacalis]